MTKYLTFIADPELESRAIKAISDAHGELVGRGTSLSQVRKAEAEGGITLVTARKISYQGAMVLVDTEASAAEISSQLLPPDSPKPFHFDSNGALITCFIGLAGGTGTTSVAINYAFEKSLTKSIHLIDLKINQMDLALLLGLRHIENRFQSIKPGLRVKQGLPPDTTESCDEYVIDLGQQMNHPILAQCHQIFILAKVGVNTASRLRQSLGNWTGNTTVILNFFDKTKIQQIWLAQLQAEFPSLNFLVIPSDVRSFEVAAQARTTLPKNSLARKFIAKL